MSGSGGFYSTRRDPVKYGKKIRDSEADNLNQQFKIDVSNLISDLLAKYNDRDTDAINQHLEMIKQKLANEIEGTFDLVFSGSVSKHTYIDGFSDVDALLVLNESSLENKSPKEIKIYLAKLIKERFPKTDLHIGSQAITVKFSDIQIQILPALKNGNGFKIANDSGNGWSNIDPGNFAKKLTNLNQELNGKLVPTIKLAKSIITQQSEKNRITGYHTESLAINAFKNYTGEKNTKNMLKWFFSQSKSLVLKPIRDKTGHSIHVDEYLGPSHGIQRKIVSNAFDRMEKKMNNADGAQSLDFWKSIFGI